MVNTFIAGIKTNDYKNRKSRFWRDFSLINSYLINGHDYRDHGHRDHGVLPRGACGPGGIRSSSPR